MGSRLVAGTAALVLSTLLAGCGGDLMDQADTASAETSATATSAAPTPTDAADASALPSPSVKPTRTTEKQVRRPEKPRITVPRRLKIPTQKMPPVFDGPVLGGDVSWPQCPTGMGIPERPTMGLPMPLPEARFVVLGLTNGPAFTPNPCLRSQVDWVKQRGLMASAYAVHSWPDSDTVAQLGDEGPFDGGTSVGRLRNVGYQQALFNLDTMRRAGLQSPILWLDVEPVPDPFGWSSDKEANAAVVAGAARGYLDQDLTIGVYSTPLLYDTVVGDLDLGGIPEWRAAGQTSQAEAVSRCGSDWSIQGGKGAVGQWVADSRDLNITCPGTEKEMFRFFHQY